jgi:CRISPR-associated endonuclease/helicase Cas3
VTYDDVFSLATGRAPFPYQRALALIDSLPQALCAPTGAGKTAAVVLGWVYRRRFAPVAVLRATPRRLVVCLPMRSLTTQTVTVVTNWLRRLDLLDKARGLDRGRGIGVHVVMGGDVDDDWHLHPEHDAIIIGTQDMLLSRALNRGYGASRFLWPWHYALLTNDSLWVYDEVQLMGVGLATGLQLSAFARKLGTFGPVGSLFMSATVAADWLQTVDHPAPTSVMTLGEEDLRVPELERRRRAPKRLERAATVIDRGCEPALAREILAGHPDEATVLLQLLALYKFRKLMVEGLRLRTACDLHPQTIKATAPPGFALPSAEALEAALPPAIQACRGLFTGPTVTRVKFGHTEASARISKKAARAKTRADAQS